MLVKLEKYTDVMVQYGMEYGLKILGFFHPLFD